MPTLRFSANTQHMLLAGMKTLLALFIITTSSQLSAYTLYLAPGGDDSNSGSTAAAPISTLQQAHKILQRDKPTGSINILILPGHYKQQTVYWTFENKQSLQIRAADLNSARPIFDGMGESHTWFRLKRRDGRDSQLHMQHLQIQNYATAISLEGNRAKKVQYHRGNIIEAMVFKQIGGNFHRGGYSVAALRAVNSRNNIIRHCQFSDILNTNKDRSHIHAIYLAHHSSNNQISHNSFSNIHGDPIRVRDQSNENHIAHNSFSGSGYRAYFSDWYCDKQLRENCTKPGQEQPSIGNSFVFNQMSPQQDKSIEVVKIFNPSYTANNQRALRVQTQGNISLLLSPQHLD